MTNVKIQAVGTDTNLLEDVKSKEGKMTSLIFGANDTLGNTPRCLTVDGNGRLLTYPYEHPSSWTNTHLQSIITNTAINRSSGALMTNEILSGSSIFGTNIDCRNFKNLRIYGLNLSGHSFFILGSQDDTNYFELEEIYPNSNFNFSKDIINAPPYIKIKSGMGETFTLHYSLIN
tara:strand:+ start:203 stop:727 length:525 start_codon:yes stop_codon:yes gene_type:complete